MTIRPTLSGQVNAIAGAVLVTLGVVAFYENLHRTAAQMSHLPGDISGRDLGVVPTVVLAAARVLAAYAADHRLFLQIVLQHILVLFCPLLIVIVGTVLSRDAFLNDINGLSKKNLKLSI